MNDESLSAACLPELDGDALTARLTTLLGLERRCIVDVLWHLAEVDRRDLHLERGHASLFAYCTDALGLTRASAWRRSTGARLLARFPAAAPYLSDGRLCLSTFVILKDVLREEDHARTLELAAGRTEDEVKVLVATLCPQPDVKDSIRRVATRPPLALAGSGPELDHHASSAPAVDAPATVPASAPPSALAVPPQAATASLFTSAPVPPRIEPLNADRYALRLSVGNEFLQELNQVKAALSHVVPDGRLEDVLRECFRRTLESCSRRKAGAPARAAASTRRTPLPTACAANAPPSCSSGPEPEHPEGGVGVHTATAASSSASGAQRESPPESTGAPLLATPEQAAAMPGLLGAQSHTTAPARERSASRYIPVNVRRDVWARDGGKCAFVGEGGRRCNATHQLEFEHRQPFACGGPPTVENIQLLCRVHNQLRARQLFGEVHMAQFTRGA